MLAYNVSAPADGEDDGTVAILLHGRGSHRGDLQALKPLLPASWWLVTPQGPHPGHPWSYGPGWAWYRYLEEDRLVDETLERSLVALDDFVRGLPGIVGRDVDRMVLGGFSQGGTTSMAYALSRPGSVDAVLNLSGFLPDSELIPADGLGAGAPPIFWGHGTRDPNIPIELAVRGRNRLRDAGVRLDARDYPIGHWIVPEELRHAIEMVLTTR